MAEGSWFKVNDNLNANPIVLQKAQKKQKRFEVETQLTIAKNVGYFDNLDENLDINFQELMDKVHSIERQLNGLINTIRKR